MKKNITVRTFRRMVAGTFLVGLSLIVATGVAFQDDVPLEIAAQDATGPDIGAILPERAPVDLSLDAFKELGENWDPWSEATADLVADLYENKELTDAERSDLVSRLRDKVETIRDCLGDDAYASIHVPLRRLREALESRLDLIDALEGVIESREPGSVAVETALRDELSESIGYLEDYLASVINGGPWRSYAELDSIRTALNDGSVNADSVELMRAVSEKFTALLKDANYEQQQFGGRFAFSRYVDSLVAYTNYIDASVSPEEFFVQQVGGLVGSIDEYGQTRKRIDAYRIRKGLRILDDLSPAGASRIQSLLGTRYLNDNLRLMVSESILSYAINQHQNNSGRVADCILEAWVTGCQVSSADITVDVQPSPNTANFSLHLNGVANSNTQGRKKPATIFTRGTHYFWGHKTVSFDGTRFTTGKTRLWVNPNNTTTGIKTDLDCIPLVGQLVQKIARQEVAKKQCEAERIASYKLAKEVVPRFDREVGDRFEKASNDLDAKLFATLRRTDLYPQRLNASSSDTDISILSRTMDGLQLAAGTPPGLAPPSSGFAIQIHESLLNNALDRLDLAGRTLSESELKSEIEATISDITGKPFSFKAEDEPTAPESDVPDLTPEALDPPVDGGAAGNGNGPPLLPPAIPGKSASLTVPQSISLIPVGYFVQDEDDESGADDEEDQPEATFNFDPVDPIRVKLVENGITVILRTGLQQEGKDDIPLQEITIPITFEFLGDQIHTRAGDAKIIPLTDTNRFKQITRAAQIKRILDSKLTPRQFDLKSIELPIEGKASLYLSIRDFFSTDGWLTVTASQ